MDVRVAAIFRIAVLGSKIKWRKRRVEVWYTHVHIIVLSVNVNILCKGQLWMACSNVFTTITTVINVLLLTIGLYGTVNFALPVPDFRRMIFVVVPCILITLKLFFYQQMHRLLNIWNVKIYIKIYLIFAPTCFGPFGPSSGSLNWAWLKLHFCKINQ